MNCPVPRCRSPVQPGALVCRWHWRRLPRQTREQLRSLHYTEAGSPGEQHAIAASIRYLDERQPHRLYQEARA